MSPSSHASCAPASLLMRITCASCSRERLVVRQAMNSRCRSAVSITAPLIARTMSGPGGRPPASIRSRLRASFGGTRVATRARKSRICHRRPLEPIDHSVPMVSTAKRDDDGLPPLPFSVRPRLYFTTPTAPPSPMSRTIAIVKPGPFTAGSFGKGCHVDTIRGPATPRA